MPNLILSRKATEQIVIGENIVVTVKHIGTKRVRLSVEAPADVSVVRKELIERGAA